MSLYETSVLVSLRMDHILYKHCERLNIIKYQYVIIFFVSTSKIILITIIRSIMWLDWLDYFQCKQALAILLRLILPAEAQF